MNVRRHGNTLIEFPAVIFLVFVVVALPLIGLSTLSYRAALFYNAVRSACAAGSRAASFNAAKNAATDALGSQSRLFTGIEVEGCTTSIVSQNRKTEVETESFSTLPQGQIDPQKNLYFLKVKALGSLRPLVQTGASSVFPAGVRGLTQPYEFSVSCELYFEHPFGLAF